MIGGRLDAAQMSPAVLAYIGDAVFELRVREMLLREGGGATARTLHRRTTALVCAQAQAGMARVLVKHLTSEESDVMRRGRNAHCGRVPAGAGVAEYRLATGLECLIGYLHLTGRTGRIEELLAGVMHQGAVEKG